jgi:hypothetical protein
LSHTVIANERAADPRGAPPSSAQSGDLPTHAKGAVIALEGVTKSYGSFRALHDITTHIPPGVGRRNGHFGFAGHSDPVRFRNLSIRKLSAEKAAE